MKKLIALVLAALISVSMAACSVSTDSGSASKAADTKASSAASPESKAESQAESKADESAKSDAAVSGKLGNYEVAIESAHLTKNYEDKPTIVVRYKFTNNSDEAISFFVAACHSALQNGKDLELTTVTDEDYKSDSMTDVNKGESIELDEAYLLNDEKTQVDVEVTELAALTDEKVTTSFDVTSAK